MPKFITPAEVKSLVKSVKHGQFFSMVFDRVAPKCTACGKSNKRWHSLTHCPECGAPLSFERETLAQLGVHNPSNTDVTPKGTGESAQEALDDGRVKYFDPQIDNHNGTHGAYRQCAIENIKRLKVNGEEYIVTKP